MTAAGFRIGGPAARGGFPKDEHLNHLLAFVEPRSETTTKFDGTGTQTAAVCSYVVCVPCRRVFTEQTIYGEALAPRLVDTESEVVVGTLAQAQSRMPGRNPAWILDDPTDTDIGAVQGFLTEYASRLKSGKIVVEQPDDEAPPPTDDDASF
jgi:hypothetical protein